MNNLDNLNSLSKEINSRVNVAHSFLFPFCGNNDCMQSFEVRPEALFVSIQLKCAAHCNILLPTVFIDLPISELEYTYEQAGYKR
jgi:hypothetical protein